MLAALVPVPDRAEDDVCLLVATPDGPAGVARAGAGTRSNMLPVHEQRRPPLTRQREHYDDPSDLALAVPLAGLEGWEIAQAVRLPDGAVEAVYVRSAPRGQGWASTSNQTNSSIGVT
jgi:hypothetical protein